MMHVTVWDSYTNGVEQLYIPVDFGEQTDPTINKYRVPKIVHDRVCEHMDRDPAEYTISQEIRPMDNHAQETGTLIMLVAHHGVETTTYSCRWQW